jgi:hypothetical protein
MLSPSAPKAVTVNVVAESGITPSYPEPDQFVVREGEITCACTSKQKMRKKNS